MKENNGLAILLRGNPLNSKAVNMNPPSGIAG